MYSVKSNILDFIQNIENNANNIFLSNNHHNPCNVLNVY